MTDEEKEEIIGKLEGLQTQIDEIKEKGVKMLRTGTMSHHQSQVEGEEVEESRPISEGQEEMEEDLGGTGMVSSKGRSKVSFVNKNQIEEF